MKTQIISMAFLILSSCASTTNQPVSENPPSQVSETPNHEEHIENYQRDQRQEQAFQETKKNSDQDNYTIENHIRLRNRLNRHSPTKDLGTNKLSYTHQIYIRLNCGAETTFESMQSFVGQKLNWKISQKISGAGKIGPEGKMRITFEDVKKDKYKQIEIVYKKMTYVLPLTGTNRLEVNAASCAAGTK